MSSRRDGATPLRDGERDTRGGGGRGGREETPASTPSYHYNSWTKDRKKTGQTPVVGSGDSDARDDRKSSGKPADMDGDGGEGGPMSERDKEQWDAEQEKLDRSWYDMEEGGGYQEEGSNPFMMNDDVVASKEAKRAGEKHVKSGVSQRKAGLNEDRDKWEEGRLISSGVVTTTGLVTGAIYRRLGSLEMPHRQIHRVWLPGHFCGHTRSAAACHCQADSDRFLAVAVATLTTMTPRRREHSSWFTIQSRRFWTVPSPDKIDGIQILQFALCFESIDVALIVRSRQECLHAPAEDDYAGEGPDRGHVTGCTQG
jgi:hypothetical protein